VNLHVLASTLFRNSTCIIFECFVHSTGDHQKLSTPEIVINLLFSIFCGISPDFLSGHSFVEFEWRSVS